MLFGAYNAGKSTLINALLGEERAVVGDIPTTDAVHRYDWDGHIMLDTPVTRWLATDRQYQIR